jgi:caffeoyl-CoA O-methyltransferase
MELFHAVDEYITRLVAKEDDALTAALTDARAAGLPEISVSAAEGKFLHVLALLCKAERILEIGTLAGYSTIWMARALPHNGRLVTIEFESAHARVAQKNFKRAALHDIIDLRVGAALDVLPIIANEIADPFDMIFIDADKENYVEYFEWAVKLGRPGTLIVADNVVRKGEVLDPASTDTRVQGAQRFNAALAATDNVTAAIIQTVGAKGHDGMALSIIRGSIDKIRGSK